MFSGNAEALAGNQALALFLKKSKQIISLHFINYKSI